MTCQHPEMRWLDCDGCKDKGITCDAQVCVDCGAAIQDVPFPYATINEIHAAIEIGESRATDRIIDLLKDTFGTTGIQTQMGGYVFTFDIEKLIRKQIDDQSRP